MSNLSNLPPGVSDADIEEEAGEFDVEILHWMGPGYYMISLINNSHNAGRGQTLHWTRDHLGSMETASMRFAKSVYFAKPEDFVGQVIYPEVITLALCETKHLSTNKTLRTGVLYSFVPFENCKACDEIYHAYDHERTT